MSINCLENWTDVHTPDGHKGRLDITRRERKLFDAGKLETVRVKGNDGLTRHFKYEELVEITEELDDVCPCCGRSS